MTAESPCEKGKMKVHHYKCYIGIVAQPTSAGILSAVSPGFAHYVSINSQNSSSCLYTDSSIIWLFY